VFSALSQIAKHSVDLAEMVVEAEIFPAVLTCLNDTDEYVKKNVAMLIREVAKHTPEVNITIPVGKIAEKAVCRSVFFRLFFLAILPTGIREENICERKSCKM